jgi:hypothetical protein
VDQGVARKAQQEPEGEMEKTETPGAAEAPAYLNFDSELGCWPAEFHEAAAACQFYAALI